MDRFVPKNIVQPLVENAIYHGISPMEGNGLINITIYNEDNSAIFIIVEDNGVGMPDHIAETLLIKQEEYKHSDGMSSIGLQNINNRIHYLYGMDWGLDICSIINRGTKVTVKIPMQSVKTQSDN